MTACAHKPKISRPADYLSVAPNYRAMGFKRVTQNDLGCRGRGCAAKPVAEAEPKVTPSPTGPRRQNGRPPQVASGQYGSASEVVHPTPVGLRWTDWNSPGCPKAGVELQRHYVRC